MNETNLGILLVVDPSHLLVEGLVPFLNGRDLIPSSGPLRNDLKVVMHALQQRSNRGRRGKVPLPQDLVTLEMNEAAVDVRVVVGLSGHSPADRLNQRKEGLIPVSESVGMSVRGGDVDGDLRPVESDRVN